MLLRKVTVAVSTLVTVAALVLVAPPANAALEVGWRQNVAGSVNDMATGPGGAIYAVGQGPADSQPWRTAFGTVSRLTAMGDVVWTRRWTPRMKPRRFLTDPVSVAVSQTTGVVYVAGNVQRSNCEGGGWFIRAYGPQGRFLWMTGTPRAWHCRPPGPQVLADVAVRGDLVVASVAGTGCCGTSAREEGRIRAYTPHLRLRWTSQFEPPPPAQRQWFDLADSLAIATDGTVYAAGWAATEFSDGETTPAGAMLVAKYSHAGDRLWSRRPGVRLRSTLSMSMELLSNHMVIGAEPNAGGIWLGALRLNTSKIWHRSWGSEAAIKAAMGGVAVDADGRIWVAGTRRDPEGGSNVYVRRYSGLGVLVSTLTIDDAPRRQRGNAVDTLGRTGFVGGFSYRSSDYTLLHGHVWRVNS
jgi:hypothetical protein